MSTLSEVDRELSLLIRAKFPILSVVSHEEWRVLARLEDVRRDLIATRGAQIQAQIDRATDQSQRQQLEGRLQALAGAHQILRWTITDGLLHWSRYEDGKRRPREVPTADAFHGVDSKDPVALMAALRFPPSKPIGEGVDRIDLRSAIYVFCDLHAWLDREDRSSRFNHVLVRALRDMAYLFKNSEEPSAMVFLSPRSVVPYELEKEIQLIDYPLPSVAELDARFDQRLPKILDEFGPHCIHLDDDQRGELMQALRGLTFDEADNVINKALVANGTLERDDIAMALQEKRQIIRKDQTLEYFDNDRGMSDVGGLHLLREWLERRQLAFKGERIVIGDREVELPVPKGILLIGIPGAGKSLVAKAVAKTWNLPLLRLDIGRIFASLVGQAEENMRRAIRIAKSVAPAILWLDEVEKAFPRTTGASDSGVSLRVMNTFLTWMQEKKEPVFVVATGNDLSQVPVELTRKGRFDELFYVGLPTQGTRIEILRIHTARFPLKSHDYELLAKKARYFTGAEIEQCVKDAIFLLPDFVAATAPSPGLGEPLDPFPRAIHAAMHSFAPLARRDDKLFRETYLKARAMAVPADVFEDLPPPNQAERPQDRIQWPGLESIG